MSEEELNKAIDIVAGIDIHSEAEAIAKETLISYVEQLQQENEELKERLDYEIQNHVMSDKNYCETISNYKNILTEFEKWLEEETNTITDTYSQINGNYFRMQPILDTLKECLGKLQEIKEKTNG